MAFEFAFELAVGQVEDADDAVRATGGDCLRIETDRDRNRLGVVGRGEIAEFFRFATSQTRIVRSRPAETIVLPSTETASAST